MITRVDTSFRHIKNIQVSCFFSLARLLAYICTSVKLQICQEYADALSIPKAYNLGLYILHDHDWVMRLNVNALCVHLSESEYYKANEHGCTAVPVNPRGIEVPIKLVGRGRSAELYN